MGTCRVALVEDAVVYIVKIDLDFAKSSAVIDDALSGQ